MQSMSHPAVPLSPRCGSVLLLCRQAAGADCLCAAGGRDMLELAQLHHAHAHLVYALPEQADVASLGVECFQLPPLLEVGAYDAAYQHDDESIAHGYFLS